MQKSLNINFAKLAYTMWLINIGTVCLFIVLIWFFQRPDYSMPRVVVAFAGVSFVAAFLSSSGVVLASLLHIVYQRKDTTYRLGGIVLLLVYGSLFVLYGLVLFMIPEKLSPY